MIDFKRIVLVTLAVPAAAVSALGADQGLAGSSLSYIVSVPTGDTGDFVDNSVSFRGLGAEWITPLGTSDFYWGFGIRWLYFRNVEDNATFQSGNVAVNGRVYSSVDAFPMAFSVKYPLAAAGSEAIPYFGLGAGATYGMQRLEVGTFGANDVGWQALVTPEIGARFNTSPGSHILANARYDLGFENGDIDAITNLSFSIGLGANF